jgi:4-amino-4-deoxy-L-arabinose transferase-like glycosyltransferase
MLQTLLAWLLVALVLIAAYPLARNLLAHSAANDGALLAWLLALGLGVGGLTLVMLWLGLLGIAYDVGVILAVYAVVLGLATWAVGRFLTAKMQRTQKEVTDGARRVPTKNVDSVGTGHAPSNLFKQIALLAIILIAAAILFNAAYWPFSRDDAIGIYAPFARMMVETRALVPLTGADSLYRAYPMGIPLAYTFSYLASGWDNEYLARMIPALMAVGCIPVTYMLGRRVGGARAGWLAALLLAVTPAYGSWASSGYVDLPMGFCYALAALFVLRYAERGAAVDALLAGVCMGLAAWTKNSALIGVGVLVGWWGVRVWTRHAVSVQHALLSLGACALIAAPWYVRNVIGAGFVMPDTAWTDQARRTVETLFIFVTLPNNFGLSGWAMLAGLAWGGVYLTSKSPLGVQRGDFQNRVDNDNPHQPDDFDSPSLYTERGWGGEILLLLWWFIPFFAAWWWFASYDPRFLQSALPLMSALGGAALAWAWERVTDARLRRGLAWALAVLVLVLTAQAVFRSVEFKRDLLRDPLMGDAAKRAIVLARFRD